MIKEYLDILDQQKAVKACEELEFFDANQFIAERIADGVHLVAWPGSYFEMPLTLPLANFGSLFAGKSFYPKLENIYPARIVSATHASNWTDLFNNLPADYPMRVLKRYLDDPYQELLLNPPLLIDIDGQYINLGFHRGIVVAKLLLLAKLPALVIPTGRV